jgi:DNA-binding transcriptional ArsR family regulator
MEKSWVSGLDMALAMTSPNLHQTREGNLEPLRCHLPQPERTGSDPGPAGGGGAHFAPWADAAASRRCRGSGEVLVSLGFRFLSFRWIERPDEENLLTIELSERLGMPANTLSRHMKVLLAAGAVTQNRAGQYAIPAGRLVSPRSASWTTAPACCVSGRSEIRDGWSR